MNKLTIPNYKILEQTSDSTTNSLLLTMRIESNMAFFNGHFTDFPIMPAVAQLNLVNYIISNHFSIKNDFYKLKQVKFKQIIKPEQLLDLLLVHDLISNSVAYKFSYQQKTFSSGIIAFRKSQYTTEL